MHNWLIFRKHVYRPLHFAKAGTIELAIPFISFVGFS
jgi:hypothetical protein